MPKLNYKKYLASQSLTGMGICLKIKEVSEVDSGFRI